MNFELRIAINKDKRPIIYRLQEVKVLHLSKDTSKYNDHINDDYQLLDNAPINVILCKLMISHEDKEEVCKPQIPRQRYQDKQITNHCHLFLVDDQDR